MTDFAKEWQQVEEFSRKGLPKSALEVVEQVYAQAKNNNDSAQMIKALLKQMELKSAFEEDALLKNIHALEAEAAASEFPVTPVLKSVLAEMYWGFYQQNRWKILDRTPLSNVAQADISTWDALKFVEKTVSLYHASLENENQLKATPLDVFDPILQQENGSRKFRPTLYDLLAHRAVDFFMNDEPSVTRPAAQFRISGKAVFASADKFARTRFETDDTLSFKYQALLILQDLLKFHLQDPQPDALVDVDLKRLQFVRSHSTSSQKDEFYLKALEALEQKYLGFPISAAVSFQIAQFYNERSGQYQRTAEASGLNETYKNDRKRAYQKCTEAIKRHPKSEGAQNCQALQTQISRKALSLSVEKINPPDQPFRGLVKFQNVPKLFVKIVSLSPETLRKARENNRFNLDQWIQFYLGQPAAATFSVDLPDDGDFHEHAVEIKFPDLPLGRYVILSGTSESFSRKEEAAATADLWISNLGFVQKIDRTPQRVSSENQQNGFFVFERTSGKPLKGVSVQTWISKYDPQNRKNLEVADKHYTTDKNGFFAVQPPANRRNASFRLDLRYKSDRLFLDDYSNTYGGYRGSRNDRTQIRTFFFTDRTIYRPGQTIYFKGLMIENDGDKNELLTNAKTTVTLFDANGQKVSDLQLTSNEYGAFSGAFTLPGAGLLGNMRLKNESGMATFSVEEYKRPRFEVTVDPVKGSFKLDEKVTISGKAASFAGANIDNAAVQYRVVRQARFPYLWDFRWMPTIFSQPVEVTNGVAATDENGAFAIDFTAVDDPAIPKEQKAVFTFTIYVDVTDVGGETHSTQARAQVGHVALAMEMDLPAEINREKAPEVSLKSENLNGEFEAAQGKIVFYKLKEPGHILRNRLWDQPDKFLMSKSEYYATFPHDVYKNEDDFRNWERGEAVFEYVFDTAEKKNFALEDIEKWAQGKYTAELTTQDKFGAEIKLTKFFTIYSLEDKEVPNHAIFWYAPFKTNGEPGDIAQVYWGSAAKDVYAHLEIHRKKMETRRVKTGKKKNALVLPILEQDRGNFSFSLFFVKFGRVHTFSDLINVPWSNKELKISYETFRDKLKPGQKEEWRLKISGPQGEKIAAEMLAAMYDASLDAFRPHNWQFSIYPVRSQPSRNTWNSRSAFSHTATSASGLNWNPPVGFNYQRYDRLDWNGVFAYGQRYYSLSKRRGGVAVEEIAMEAPSADKRAANDEGMATAASAVDMDATPLANGGAAETFEEVNVRTNLNETAFFYPDLRTNEDGEIILSFTMPEALTRWKFLGFAHTKDLKYALTEQTVVTQKELMVTPNAPRFFREGDAIVFSGKVSNLSEKDLSGSATLQLFDALNMTPVDDAFGNANNIISFDSKAGQSASLRWKLRIPEGVQAVTYRIIAKTDNFSDGEENTLPVLTNRMLVTESLPLPIRGKQTKTFTLKKLLDSGKSKTLRNERLTLEFTSNPAWYAVQALPYLMEYPYECSEQIYSRYYANSLAAHIANANPKIKRVFETWRNTQPEALLSNLEKNQELKALLLEETPWVLQAQSESERKKRIGLLFDLNKMAYEQQTALRKLQQMQNPSGAWPWFPGLKDNRYITAHIVAGLGHLERLGVMETANDAQVQQMVQRAIVYLDEQMNTDYQQLLEHSDDLEKQHVSGTQIHYLYARSFFMKIPVQQQNQTAFDYWISQEKKYWLSFNKYLQGMIGLSLHRLDDKKTPREIIASLREHSLQSEEFGMHWRNDAGYYWYEAPIETQALMIELFDEVADDQKAVNEMRVWLLKQKQTQDWKTTKATAEACYALLLRGTEWLADDRLVEVTVGDEKINPAEMENSTVEAGTGYFKVSWRQNEITPAMGRVTVIKPTEGVAWGALYWQYFEQLDKITPHETPLKLKKALFLQQNTPAGPVLKLISGKTKLKPGDLVQVRIELRVDRNLEYVHMKDMRAAGFEPLNVFSQAKWQGGMGYYESTRDASTNFFFGYLPRGTYVFEYPLRVTHDGDFSNGITTIQSMYAPEFTSHSEGIRVRVGE